MNNLFLVLCICWLEMSLAERLSSKFLSLSSKLRFSAEYSVFGQFLRSGLYQPTYQPAEGVYLQTNVKSKLWRY